MESMNGNLQQNGLVLNSIGFYMSHLNLKPSFVRFIYKYENIRGCKRVAIYLFWFFLDNEFVL